MYVETVPNRNSPPAVLLRQGRRQGRRVIKETLANLSHWPPAKVAALRAVLRGEPLVSPQDCFEIERSLPHGHVQAVLGVMRKLGLETLLSGKRCRERDVVAAMVVERVLEPCSKLATTRLWATTTLGEQLSVADTDVEELYGALDWLLARQGKIERALARRHLGEGAVVLYDVSSSYYEGRTCPLARFGHDRDGAGDRPIIVYGVLTDGRGCPVAVEVYAGNTSDSTTVPDQVDKLRQRFELEGVVLVGDRGMLTQTQIETLRQYPGLGWVSALRSEQIRALVESGPLQLSLFDQQNLAEIVAPDPFPGERLVACYNPLLADDRRRTRQELLAATEEGLEKIRREAARRTRKVLSAKDIALKVGRLLPHYKMAKHFTVTIGEGTLSWSRKDDSIRAEEALDGIYVIRTSEPAERLSAPDTVRTYKTLADVERLFRTLKGIDLRIRPIFHRTDPRVRAHIFLCLLAYYVEWHMRQALAPLLFDDETLSEERRRRDPVAPAKPTPSARRKKTARQTPDGLPLHSFHTLLKDLATLCRNHCRMKNDPDGPGFTQTTRATALQRRAFELLGVKCSQ